MHLGHGVGIAALIGAIAFAFGKRTAQACVGVTLLIGAAFFLYIAVRIITGTV